MAKILVAGEALVEIMRTERDRPLDRPALFAGPFPSGAPAIFGSAAARMGGSVAFCGTVGDDAFGRCIKARLLDDGIDCGALRLDAERLTGIAFVAYAGDGSRSFLFHLPESAAAQVGDDQVPEGWVTPGAHLHVMGSSLTFGPAMRDLCYSLAREVHDSGGTVSLDPNLRPELVPVDETRALCEPVVEVCDVVLPSGEELLALAGTTTVEAGAAALLRRGVDLVALKRGAQGSTLYASGGSVDIPPFAVKEVDPTGAGDCYDASLIVLLREGYSSAVAGELANAAGALATTVLGPMEGAVTREEALAFMQEQGRPWSGLQGAAR